MSPEKRTRAGSATTSGRWTLVTKGTGARLVYQPAKSEDEVSFDLSSAQIAKARAAAAKGDPAELRDVVLGDEVRADLLQSSGASSVVASNTWRWALPLFGGAPPSERTKPHKPRKRKFM